MEENYSIERIMNELIAEVQEEQKEEKVAQPINYEEKMEERTTIGNSMRKRIFGNR
mgnify:CR=1 FL=1